MRTFAATILALTLAAPAAVGQSQGLAIDSVRQAAYAATQVATVSASSLLPGNPLLQLERSGGTGERGSRAPDPLVSWAMAIVFLGLVVMRRTRSPMP